MNDNSIMPFGKHKGKKLANVPAQYLLWLYNQQEFVISSNLKDYISDNLEVLQQETNK